MPSGMRSTPMVATTARVARSITETLPLSRSVIQSSVPRGCTATPQGPLPTGTVAATVPFTRFTSETVSSRKLLMAAMANVRWHACTAGAGTGWQRPSWHTSLPLHTSPSLQRVPSGSIWQVGEQQSPAAVLPSSQVSPASTMPLPQIGPGIVVVVVLVVVVDVLGWEVVVVVVIVGVVVVVVVAVVVVVVLVDSVTVVGGTLVVVVVGTDEGTQS